MTNCLCFLILLWKHGFNFWCKLSLLKTNCMKYQADFLGKIRTNIQNIVWKCYPAYKVLTLVLLNPDTPCHCKQYRSRSVGFSRSQLIWIYTVFHSVCEFISTMWIKESDWLKIRSGCAILIYSAWQGLILIAHVLWECKSWNCSEFRSFLLNNLI